MKSAHASGHFFLARSGVVSAITLSPLRSRDGAVAVTDCEVVVVGAIPESHRANLDSRLRGK